MKDFYKTRLLLLFCLALSFASITSCDDDDENNPAAGQVELLSFGPTGVQHGQEIRFIGHNLNRVEAIELPGVTVPKANFVEQTATLIRLVVPEETTEGKVTLKLSQGADVVSKTVLSFEVPVTVSAVTKKAKPGTNITIAGTKLNWVEGVVFGKDTVDEFVSQSATELVLQVPATAKTGTLLLLGGGTKPTFVETAEALIVTLPEVTALTPGAVHNGANLTIKGTDLDLVKAVKFTGLGDALVSKFVSQSATQLVVKVPDNAATGTLTLIAISDEEVAATQALNVILPEVTEFSPDAVKHGENLTITGTNLNLVKEIKFTGVGEAKATKLTSQSATQLVVKVPDNASDGILTLLANSGMEVATVQKLAIILPVISLLSPGIVDPGQELTISGSNLDLVKSITFQGGANVSAFVSQSADRLVVKVPLNAKKGVLTLTTIKNYVVETSAQVTIILPAITSVSPEPVVAESYLTLSGTELDQVKSVVFTGGAAVSAFIAQNANQIVLKVPAKAQTGILTLITNSGFTVTTDKQVQVGTAAPNISSYIYNDALNTAENETWQLWGGWGTATQDVENTENVSRGTKAIKVVYNDAYGALQFHPVNANILSGKTHLVLYVRGTVDCRLAIQVKNAAGVSSGDVAFDVKAGLYTLVEIPVSALGDVSSGLAELLIKNYGTNPNTVYLDDIGFR